MTYRHSHASRLMRETCSRLMRPRKDHLLKHFQRRQRTTAVLCDRNTDEHLCRPTSASCTNRLLSVSLVGFRTNAVVRFSQTALVKSVHRSNGNPLSLATNTSLKQSSNENVLVQLATSIRLDTLPTKTCLCILHMHMRETHFRRFARAFCHKHKSDTLFRHNLAFAFITSACVKYLAMRNFEERHLALRF